MSTLTLAPPVGMARPQMQRVPVRIAWVNPPADLALRPGLSADVTVHVK